MEDSCEPIIAKYDDWQDRTGLGPMVGKTVAKNVFTAGAMYGHGMLIVDRPDSDMLVLLKLTINETREQRKRKCVLPHGINPPQVSPPNPPALLILSSVP